MRALLLSLLTASALFAQTASLTGRISDPTGAVVPQASVKVESASSGLASTEVSNEQGYYNFPALQPGVYNVTISKAGFKPIRETRVELAVQQAARLDLVLEVGAVTETIDVSAKAMVLDTESSTVGQVVENKQVVELPLLGRNPYALAMLVPGVRHAEGVNNLPIDQISTVSFVINGQRAAANEFLLDGGPNTAPSQNQPVIYANPDFVQEFKVETNTFSAEYGRAAGGIFNVITKSGTNDPHFTLYEFLRNDKLNANDFFSNLAGNRTPPFKFNQFGGSWGSPVVVPRLYNGRNKTFIFANVEFVRFVQGITFTGTVPTARQLTGDFSQTRNAAGATYTLFDPLSTTKDADGSFVRTAFPGSIIPANRINPVAAAISKYFPAPNAAGNAITGVNNFSRNDGNRVRKDTVSARGDHYFSERNRLFSRFSYDDTPFIRAAPYTTANPGSPGTGPQVFSRRNAVVEDDHTFGTTMLGTFRYTITRLSNFRPAFSEGFDVTTLGFPASLQQTFPPAFPYINITGYNVTGSIPNIVVGGSLGATDVIALGNDIHAWQAQLTKTAGRHTIKTGFEYRLIKFNLLQTGANTPNYAFTAAWTQGPNPNVASATAGHALASFLLGVENSGGVNPAPALAIQSTYWGGFVQDTWTVTSRLTVNAGLRYDYESPRTDRFNQLEYMDYNATPPLKTPGLNLRGGVAFVGVDGHSRFNGNPDRNNFAPRLGMAYRINNKTVLRAGGGIFFGTEWGVGTGSTNFGSTGFTVPTNQVVSLDGVTPISFLNNPFPSGLNQPTGSSLGAGTALGQSILYSDLGDVIPYSEQWNFNIQRELPGTVLVEIGYAGSHGVKLPFSVAGVNQLPDAALALGNSLRDQVPNPFYGQIATGVDSTPTVARAQLLRPYPQFDSMTALNQTLVSSIYHALEIKVEKHYSRGLTIMGSYTRSKLIDYDIGAFAGESLGGGVIQDFTNLRASRSVSQTDQPNRFVLNTVYDLPGSNLRGVAGRFLGGWEIGGILSAYTGGPIGISSAVNNTFSQGGNQRPNWSGQDPSVANPTYDHWINGAVFSNPPAFTFGNLARTLSILRSAPLRQFDLSLHKKIGITEKLALQFRAEAFNLANSPQFAPPNSTFGSPQFGVVSAQSNLPRIVQFALKLTY